MVTHTNTRSPTKRRGSFIMTTKKTARKTAKKAVKKQPKKAAKKTVRKVTKTTKKKTTKKAAKKTIKRATKKTAKKDVKKTARKATKATKKRAAKKTAKKPAKVISPQLVKDQASLSPAKKQTFLKHIAEGAKQLIKDYLRENGKEIAHYAIDIAVEKIKHKTSKQALNPVRKNTREH